MPELKSRALSRAEYDPATISSATYTISLEPEGGSPTGVPTGPILFTGTLVESVPQNKSRRLTTFEQRYIAKSNGRSTEHRFELTFRTLSVRRMTERLERQGFEVDRVLGDYRGGPWDARADVWIILVKKR